MQISVFTAQYCLLLKLLRFFFPKDASMDPTAGTQYLIGEDFIYKRHTSSLQQPKTQVHVLFKKLGTEILMVILMITSNTTYKLRHR